MNIDKIHKLTQIGFYIIAGIIAVLTYIKAKNGLLNTVNTEYKKRVMDRLAEISNELFSEFDPDSENYWARNLPVDDVLGRIHADVRDRKDDVLKGEKISSHGIPVSSKEMSLYRLIKVIQSDPFIPKDIRSNIIEFLEGRTEVMREVFHDEIMQYQADLASGKHWEHLDTNHLWLHNRIIDKLNERGCGISQIEEEVHSLRDSIQNYFEQYDPIKKKA